MPPPPIHPQRPRYALLDRDGTIVVEKNYLRSADDLEFLPNAIEGLNLLAAQWYQLIIITNQSGIARGLMTVEEVEAIHAELTRRLYAQGVFIRGIYYCPHSPEADCECRKPRTGLVERARAEHGFRLDQCLVIGDKTSDIELGRNIGARRSILVRTGYGKQHEATAQADVVADDLLAAARGLCR